MTAPNPADSILDSIKQALGVGVDNEAFDIDITMFINAVFGSLLQIGVGPSTGFFITDNSTVWSDYTTRTDMLGLIQTFMTLKVKFVFDPSSSRYAIAAVESIMAEYEWRIRLAAELPEPVAQIIVVASWWDLTGLSEFPTGAIVGDLGIDWSDGDLWVDGSSTTATNNSFFWDLTELSDFPAGAVVGDLGIDMSTGDVWRFS